MVLYLLQNYLKVIAKVSLGIQKVLLKFDQTAYASYMAGYSHLYWCVYWLIIRLAVRPALIPYLHIDQETLVYQCVFTVLSTICFLVLALIPTVITSTSIRLFEKVYRTHAKLLYSNQLWKEAVVTLVLIESWTMFSNRRRLIVGLLVLAIFVMNFLANGTIYLLVWLAVLYPFMYYTKVVYHIFPNYPRNEIFSEEIDRCLYDKAVNRYYGVKSPVCKIKARKTNSTLKRFHTTTKNLVLDDLVGGGKGGWQMQPKLQRDIG